MALEATIYVGPPKRVTLAELDQLRAEQAESTRRRIHRAGSTYSVRYSPCSPVALAPESALVAIEPCSASVCTHQAEILGLRQQAGYWRSMHSRARQREHLLHERIAQLQAEIRDLKHRLYGRKSEAASSRSGTAASSPPRTAPRPRGQQRDQPGPSRRDHSHLPAVADTIDLPPDQRCCSRCQLPFAELSSTEDSETIEIEVEAYRRVHRRRRYQPTCSCASTPV